MRSVRVVDGHDHDQAARYHLFWNRRWSPNLRRQLMPHCAFVVAHSPREITRPWRRGTVTRDIDLAAVGAERDRLWAEALARAGEREERWRAERERLAGSARS